MPELPEVETIKTAIQKSVGYSNIISVKVNNNKLREIIPADLPQKITGAVIVSYSRIAKYIIIGLDNGLSLIWHLGMSGKVKISDDVPEPVKHDHVIITTAKGVIVFNDARRFGLLTYCPTVDLAQHHLLAGIGLEPWDEKLTAAYLLQKLKNRKTPVKTALLDQSLIVGIGNIYASEALYRARILPTRTADSMSESECGCLIEQIRVVLEEAIRAGGSTLRDYQKPDGSLGYFQNMHCVYNKTGQRCPDCICQLNQTGGIQKIVQAGRSTYYCPVLQK